MNNKDATLFNSLSSEHKQQRQKTHEYCRQFARSPSKGNLSRLKSLLAQCGEEVFIEQGFYCDYGNKISLGNRVYINANCTFIDGGHIHIDDDCLIGPNVQLLTINHATSPKQRLAKQSYSQDIVLAKNVWLGAGVIVLPGVHIGEGAVLGAGSVVTHNVMAGCLYVGNPAKKQRCF